MSLLDVRKLASSIESSDPRDPRQQALIHERIVQLRNELGRAHAADLAAYLDSAAHLTDYLVHMGRMGPDEVLEIVARLLNKVEEAFELPDLEAPKAPNPALASEAAVEPAEPNISFDEAKLVEACRIGQSDERMLGEIMVQLGQITTKQLEQGLVTQRATDQRIGEALVSIGAATWDQVKDAVAVQKRLRSAIRLDASR